MKPQLSIIIVNYNTFPFLEACIRSISASTLGKDNYEIIVVDNASKDDSVQQIRKKFPAIHLIGNNENSGFAAANNLAIKKSKGDYILLLNPDTIVEPESLEIVLNYLHAHQDVGIATCRVELPNGHIDDGCHRGFPTPWNALCHFSGISRLFPHSRLLNGYHLGYKDMDKIHEIDSCVGAFLMTRREVGDQLRWLDEDYFWYGEDLDFCYRAKEKHWKVVYISTTKIIHHKGVASGIKKHSSHLSSADKEIKIRATRARFAVMRIFYQKHYQHRYPKWLMNLVMSGISLKEHVTNKQLGL